jgi:hypothetical protein
MVIGTFYLLSIETLWFVRAPVHTVHLGALVSMVIVHLGALVSIFNLVAPVLMVDLGAPVLNLHKSPAFAKHLCYKHIRNKPFVGIL